MAELVKKNQFPLLCEKREGDVFASPEWEFRADRSSHSVSMLSCAKGTVGIWVQPYSEEGGSLVRNGVFAKLPDRFGISCGYGNFPVTFLEKENPAPSTQNLIKTCVAEGEIIAFEGKGRLNSHDIIRHCYYRMHQQPTFQHPIAEAAKAILDRFVDTNFKKEYRAYTNQCIAAGGVDGNLEPWRPLNEIGWTGGAVLAHPFLLASEMFGLTEEYWSCAESPHKMIDKITAGYREASGFLNDVVSPWNPLDNWSMVKGWWSQLGLTGECHCAYTNGSAVYYILESVRFLRARDKKTPEHWLDTCAKVCDTVLELQREDGNIGYTYETGRKAVRDWDGFAGCWLAAAMAVCYQLTGKECYLNGASKAQRYYKQFVAALSCYGTPMDTWKAIDEEGNLAFIKLCRLLHQSTGIPEYLQDLQIGLDYECNWRYAFAAKPEFAPLRDSGWNSCGGSITSVSNPHMHPMGLITIEDFDYYYRETGDVYYRQRADDSLAWAMNTLELYPDTVTCGQFGVLSERYCPSDGLTIERNPDGSPASVWFSYNGWAAASALEGLLQYLRIYSSESNCKG